MSHIYIPVIIIVIVIGGFFIFKKDKLVTNFDSKGTTIVAFGDSLVSGYGSTQGNDFVSLVSKEINEPIINLGVSGNTSAMGLDRIDEVIAQNPKIVFVLFGGNDFLRNIPIETTFKNIEEIIIQLQDAGSAVVLLGVRGGVVTDPYAKKFKDLAQKHGTLYVSNVLQNLFGNKELMSDAIHPSDRGHQIIADRVIKVLDGEL